MKQSEVENRNTQKYLYTFPHVMLKYRPAQAPHDKTWKSSPSRPSL